MPSTGEGLEEAEYEVLPPLNPLQTSHNHLYTLRSSKPNRFSFIENDAGEKPKKRASRQVKTTTEPARPDSVTMKRRTSRLGMFGLFSRTKNPEFQVAESALPPSVEEEETPAKEVEIVPIDSNVSANNASSDPKDESDSDPALASLRRRASKRALKTKESFIRQKPKTWEPPPLFQAYPQSVKHATLSTPTMLAESLIRLNQERQQKSAEQAKSGEQTEMTKKQKEKKLRKSQAFELANSRDWTPKVFALVTEGYLLQYAGQGSHDRLPEKILPLCKQTAAFASDVIRGKPFVLQISQTSGEDAMVDTDISKELLKKANLKSEIKRTASAFLLVLGSPEEMNEWLVAVRKEIEHYGGKEYHPEIFGTDGMKARKASIERKTSQALHRVPSQRYLVKRDPYQFSPKMPDSPVIPPHEEKHLEQPKPQIVTKGLGISTTNRYSLATSDSTYSRYQSDTTASIDQAQLDKLRETPRQSYMSADAKTASTSRCSSMDRSPILGRHGAVHDHDTNEQVHQGCSTPRGEKKPEALQIIDRATPTPQTISGVSTPTAVVSSPSTPNFSVPTFSKRFSATPGSLTSRSASQASQTMTLGADQNLRKASIERRPESKSSQNRSVSKTDSRPSSQIPWSAESNNRPQSAGSDARYSRRNSSLNYARGISPIPLPRHSPSPHPPPTIALPPLPTAAGRPPTTGVPAPKMAPPPPPVTVSTAPASVPLLRPPMNDAVLSSNNPVPRAVSSIASAIPSQTDKPRKLRRPVSMQVRRRPPTPPNSHHAMPRSNSPNRHTFEKPKSPLVPSQEFKRVVQQPPAAPPPSPKLSLRKLSDTNHLPPVPQGSRAPAITRASNDSAADRSEPHAYIPPIRLSDRRSGLSLDGPWNNASFALS